MTSSQTLTLNYFGPLISDPIWLAETLHNLGLAPKNTISHAFIEHAQREATQNLGDRTILDAYLETAHGVGSSVIAFETKLADRFSSRYLGITENPRYRQLNSTYGLWDPAARNFGARAIEQLARTHALATSLGRQRALLVVIYHPYDRHTPEVVEKYRETLLDPMTVALIDLRQFTDAMRSAQHVEIVSRLETRYVALEGSETLWRTFEESRTHSRVAPTR